MEESVPAKHGNGSTSAQGMEVKATAAKRKVNPADIKLPPGYKIEVFAEQLNTPISMIITDKGEMLVADAGVTSGNGRVLRLTKDGFRVIADGFNPPLTGINYYNGNIYVSHRGN